MDYQRIHNAIIERAKHRTINELINSSVDGYYETHHIIPRSEGGKNTPDNLVNLTAREHFLIHWLLHRIAPSIKSRSIAFWVMARKTTNVLHKRGYSVSGRIRSEEHTSELQSH